MASQRFGLLGLDLENTRSDAISAATPPAPGITRTIAPMESPVTRPGAFVSVGYERRSVDELVDLLLDNSVDILVDVRLNAISRKKGFSKSALAGVLAEAGIGYRHERELGNPKDNREPFRRGLKSARDRYVRHLGNGAGPVYDELVALAQTVRVALLCFERDHIECHRSCITDGALQADPSVVLLKL